MNVAIIGYAVENQAALRYWQQKGATITVCDENPDVQVSEGVQSRLGPTYLDDLDGFDVIVRTVGMRPDVITGKYPDAAGKITTAINLFFEECQTPVIGVTGTKGKGTTATLISKFLEAAGKKVLLGGNIGVPLLDLLPQTAGADYVVAELSSFQLIDMKYSPHIAVCLMVVPEHQDWHNSPEEYFEAKKQLFLHQKHDDLAVFNRASAHSTEIAGASGATKLSYEVPGPGAEPSSQDGAYVAGDSIYMGKVPVCKVSDVALLGRHNLENICAAIAATWEIILHNTDTVTSVLKSFTGLEHRLELVRELGGVKYYDDSFGTTPETAIVAIQAFAEPKVVILGGSDKGASYEGLAHVVATNNVKAVIKIGETGPAIEKALRAAGYENVVDGGQTMQNIVMSARAQAATGDIVLLSTACASFDLFEDYKDRGDQFKKAVQSLA